MPKKHFPMTSEELRAKLQEHPLEIEGAFTSFLSKAQIRGENGELSQTVPQWARLWRTDEKGACRIINYMISERLVFSDMDGEVTVACNASVTLVTRYQSPEEKKRAEKEKEQCKFRKREYDARKREAKREAKRMAILDVGNAPEAPNGNGIGNASYPMDAPTPVPDASLLRPVPVQGLLTPDARRVADRE